MKNLYVVNALAVFITFLFPQNIIAQAQTKELIPAEAYTQTTTAPTPLKVKSSCFAGGFIIYWC